VARIGILGGTFNPIHLAHLTVAEEVREKARLDQVMFLPAGQPPHRQGEVIPEGAIRLEMVELGTRENPHFRTSGLELERPGPSYTVDSMRHLREELGTEEELFLIVGADNVLEFASWKEPDSLLRTCNVIVATRPGYSLDRLSPWMAGHVSVVPVTSMAISSADIRCRVREGRSIRYLVPETVRRLIEARGLYLA
jgi:nicotinate-nucleotide adenylyltransferase